MAMSEKEKDSLFSEIAEKIKNAAVLNGGFDRIASLIETIKEQQENQSAKLDKINDRLYEPDKGLFSRVQQLENDVGAITTDISEHIKAEAKDFEKIEKNFEEIDKIQDLAKKVEIDNNKLKKISGDEFENLRKSMELHKRMTTLFWGIVALATTGFANIIWQLLIKK